MNKKLFLLPVAVAGMSLVACGGGDNPEPGPEPTDLTVNLVSKSLDISYSSITKDNDFVATISLKGEYESKYRQKSISGLYVKNTISILPSEYS